MTTSLRRRRAQRPIEDPAAWFRFFSTDPAARAAAIAALAPPDGRVPAVVPDRPRPPAPPVPAAPADAPPMLKTLVTSIG